MKKEENKKDQLTDQERELINSSKLPNNFTPPLYAVGSVVAYKIINKEDPKCLELKYAIVKNITTAPGNKYSYTLSDGNVADEKLETINPRLNGCHIQNKVPALVINLFPNNALDKKQEIILPTQPDDKFKLPNAQRLADVFYHWIDRFFSLREALGEHIYALVEIKHTNMKSVYYVGNRPVVIGALANGAITDLFVDHITNGVSVELFNDDPIQIDIREYKTQKDAYKYLYKRKV